MHNHGLLTQPMNTRHHNKYNYNLYCNWPESHHADQKSIKGTKDKSWQPIPGLGGETPNLDNERRLGPTYYIDDML